MSKKIKERWLHRNKLVTPDRRDILGASSFASGLDGDAAGG